MPTSRGADPIQDRLKNLMALPYNKLCADCGTHYPRWASVSLGVFVCLRCAGFHRGLGVHYSKVKSCSLDLWTEEQVRSMEEKGNKWAELEYGPPMQYGTEQSSHAVETYIRRKYVDGQYQNQLLAASSGGKGAKKETKAVTKDANLLDFMMSDEHMTSNELDGSFGEFIAASAIETPVLDGTQEEEAWNSFQGHYQQPPMQPSVPKIDPFGMNDAMCGAPSMASEQKMSNADILALFQHKPMPTMAQQRMMAVPPQQPPISFPSKF